MMIGVSLTARINGHFMNDIMYDTYCVGLQELMIDQIQMVSMKELRMEPRFSQSRCHVRGVIRRIGMLSRLRSLSVFDDDRIPIPVRDFFGRCTPGTYSSQRCQYRLIAF